ncbi:ABC transporter ATP-binding protein [Bacillus halotolerans]|uniref:ABC transporter ATP-binding protein n=2 Tax=Bacillus subtilis group TaxID=653685 RepID=UPI002DBC8205|nr:ABC transporter ATP-binding protein [Bacillus halotolerans]MEC1545431.1 ABC transporter ATP-binding protein [Bacillus halotolerans]
MFRNVFKVIKIYTHISKLSLIILLLFSVMLSILPIYSLTVTEEIGNNISKSTDFSKIIWLLIFQAFLYISIQILSLINSIIENNLDYKFTYHFELKLINKVGKIKTSTLDNSTIYNDILQVSQIIPLMGTRLLIDIIELFKGILSITGLIVILKNLHWSIVTLLVIISVINFLMSRLYNKEELAILNKTSEIKRKKDTIWDLLKNRESVVQIKMFQVGDYLINKWSKYYWKAVNPERRLNNKREFLVQILMIGTQILQLVILIIFIISNWPNIPIGTFMLLIQAISQFQGFSHQIVGSLTNLHQTIIYLPLYFNILNKEEEESTGTKKINFDKLEHSIRVKDLSFRYSNSESYSLKHVNLEILKGEKVAVVGFNGSGKTTLIKCLIGLYDNYDGSIYYDSREIQEYNQDTIRKQIGWLAQDFIEYPYSLEENIYLGDMGKRDPDLTYSLERSLVNEFAKKLPLKLKTVLDPSFEEGIDLSGGQWQKVALARLYYRDSNLMVMDEPTSAIDPISENKIYKNLFKEDKDKTIIILTHRLNVCTLVDKVIVMKDGKITDIGSHKELIKSSSYYNKLYTSQTQDGYLKL